MKYKDEMIGAGWTVIEDTPSSTSFSISISTDVKKEMKHASQNLGYLSSGTVIIGDVHDEYSNPIIFISAPSGVGKTLFTGKLAFGKKSKKKIPLMEVRLS